MARRPLWEREQAGSTPALSTTRASYVDDLPWREVRSGGWNDPPGTRTVQTSEQEPGDKPILYKPDGAALYRRRKAGFR